MSARGRPLLALGASLGVMAGLSWAYSAAPQGEASRRQLWGLGQANYQEFREKLNARQLPEVDSRLMLGLAETEPEPVTASPAGGAFGEPVAVELRGTGTIHYTLDGSIPTRRSPIYNGPLRFDSSAVVRARVLPRGSLPGPVSTWHFALGSSRDVPMVSIASDPVGLWNKYSGIYANPESRGRSWEREAHVGYIMPGRTAVLAIPAEIRIHGGYSRLVSKKSFRIRFDDSSVAVATKKDHVLRSAAIAGVNTVVIRGDGANPAARIRDALASRLYEDIGGTVSRGEPIEVFLNGRYWGMYDLREHVGENYLMARFGTGNYEHLAHDSENVSDWLTPVVGNRDGWDEALRRLATLDLSSAEGLAAAALLFDLDNIVDYWLHNIYTANVDWPYNNAHVYRRLDGTDRRWKWIAWDLDPAFLHLTHNTLAWSLRDTVRNDLKWNYDRGSFEDGEMYLVSTSPLRALLRNPSFRDQFIGRAQVLLELQYTEEKVIPVLDSILALSTAARRRDASRWGWADTTFSASVDWMRTFIRERPAHVRSHLAEQFGLGEAVSVRIGSTGPGAVRLEDYTLPAGEATLRLLRGTRVRLSALPDSGAVLDAGPAPDMVLEIDGPMRIDYRFRRRR